MSQVLYRKYRPQTFADLTGQEPIRKILENEIKTGKISHAYLFTGPRGLGKTTSARLLAKAVNCQNRKEGASEPCNNCPHCQAVIAGNFLDLIEIDAASHTGVDNVRETIIETVRFSPNQAKYKVFIIDEVHMLSNSSFNALLKTIEEPPAHAIFILCTTEPHKIPETIISRCQRFDFKKVSRHDIVKRLEKIAALEQVKISAEVLEIIAARAQGGFRDAESLFQQILSLGEKDITLETAALVLPRSNEKLILEFVSSLLQNNTALALEQINNLMTEGLDLERFSADALEFLRQLLIYKINPNLCPDLSETAKTQLNDLSRQISPSRLTQLIELFLEKIKAQKQTEIPQLSLELLALEFCDSSSVVNHQPSSTIDHQPLNNKDTLGLSDDSNIDPPTASASSIQTSSNKSVNAIKSINAINTSDSNDSRDSSPKLQAPSIQAIDPVQLNNSWPQILVEVQKHNHSICAFLKTGQILCVKDNLIEIGFPYKFHEQTIKNEKNRKIVEDCISKIINQNVKVAAKHLESLKTSSNNQASEPVNALMTDLIQEFGGEVVE